MGKSKILGGGAGNVVNGIIEQYYAATDDVKANTFVEYVEKFQLSTPSAGTQIATSNICNVVSAVKLSDNKVFIAYNNYQSLYYYAYGVVCTIENGVVSAGTPVVIDNTQQTSHTAKYITAMALTSTKVAVAYSTSEDETTGSAWSVICTISEKSISVGTRKELTSSIKYWKNIRAAKLSSSKFIVICFTQNNYLYSAVCSVSGTTITMGTAVSIRGYGEGSIPYCDIAALSSSKAIVAFSKINPNNTSYYSVYVMVLSISGTTITTNSSYKTDANDSYVYMNIKALSEDKAILAWKNNTSGYENLQICTVSGTTVSLGTRVVTNWIDHFGWLEVLDENSLICYYEMADQSRAELISVSGTVITVSNTTVNFAKAYTGISKEKSKITFVQYISGLLLFVYSMESTGNIGVQTTEFLNYKGITPLTASAKFLGLTMTKATKTSQGKVWTLKGE